MALTTGGSVRNVRIAPATYPEPCEHCQVCDWSSVCDSRWRQDDHLSLVAGIMRCGSTWSVR